MNLEHLAAALADAIARTGPLAPAVLFLATFVEYVFPPFPGDVLVVLGAWYAVQGELSWPATFASVTAGAIAGAWVDYRIGAAIGRRMELRAARRSLLSLEKLARFEAAYRRWGAFLLLANRFFPTFRAVVFYAAGATRIPLRKVLILGAISSALWNAALLAAGAFLASNVNDLIRLLGRYTRGATLVLALAALGVGGLLLWRRRRARAPAGHP